MAQLRPLPTVPRPLSTIVVPLFRRAVLREWIDRRSAVILRGIATIFDVVSLAVVGAVVVETAPALVVFTALAVTLTFPTRRQRALLQRRAADQATRTVGGLALASVATDWLVGDVLVAPAIVLASTALLAGRAGFAWCERKVRESGDALEDAVIVGGGPIGIGIARVLEHRREFGLRPVGYLESGEVDDELPTLGTPQDLPGILREHCVRRVIVVYGRSSEHELVPILRACDELPFEVDIHVLPRFFELGVLDEEDADDLWGFPLIPMRRGRPAHVNGRMTAKRALDVVVSALGLILAAPLLAAIAYGVWRSSPGPVLFRQIRIGQGGRPFQILKFRTMLVNDDSDTQWTVDHDSRVTRIGRFLRTSHLDELPQLVNVLKGDMSLIGPRPERPAFVDQFSASYRGYEDRHRVPVGLTGWAQVNGLWGNTSMEDRARFDNRYIEDWSFVRDLVILARTVPSLLGRRDDDE